MKKFGNTRFEYDANGLRRKKGNKEYVWSGDRLLYEKEDGEITTRYFYDASGIAGYNYRGGEFKFRKNLQGDIIGIIDNTGTLLGTYEYDAWGNCTATKVIISGTSMVLSMNPFRYRGYYFDSETGLYYLQSRYYDPKTGRFISPDAYSYLEPETVNGLNLYSYCNNNPVMYADPSGHIAFLAILLLGILGGAAAGGVIGGVSAVARGDSFWSGVASGALLGGALGGALALGGATMLAVAGKTVEGFIVASSLAAKTGLLLGSAALSVAMSAGAGMGAYAIRESMNGREIYTSEMLRQGLNAGIKGGIAFITGMALATAGLYNSLIKGAKIISKARTIKMIVSTTLQLPWRLALDGWKI